MKTRLTFACLIVSLAFACNVGSSSKSNNTNNTNNINNTNNTNNTNNNTNNTNNTNNQQPQLVSFQDSGCKNQKSIDFGIFDGFECVVWSYDGTGALDLRHVNALFNCCPDEQLGMTGTVDFANNVFTLIESDNGGTCFCMCPYDLAYQLTGVAPGVYQVQVAPFTSPVAMDLSAAAEGWFCIDRLLDASYNLGQGRRGAPCQSSDECMGGNGYCFSYGADYSPVCVNGCSTTEDCPMPALEECLEDAQGVRYCSPTTEFGQ